jgi:aromatic ring-opening dioxygenase catalytic subunit (LigB family)
MPLMGQFPSLTKHLQTIPTLLDKPPSAIVVISAHWESNGPIAITSHCKPSMLFDYHGFPQETYQYQYPAPGSPTLAHIIQKLLETKQINAQLDPHRGFDHGVFVPLMIMFPQADIPVVTVSLNSSLDAEFHLNLGEALSPLRYMTLSSNESTFSCENSEGDILVLGSGFTFHNMKAFFHPNDTFVQSSVLFNNWLKATLTLDSWSDRRKALMDWKNAPGAKVCHPREEHLLPLLVVAAAGKEGTTKVIYDTSIHGKDEKDGWYDVSGYCFQ